MRRISKLGLIPISLCAILAGVTPPAMAGDDGLYENSSVPLESYQNRRMGPEIPGVSDDLAQMLKTLRAEDAEGREEFARSINSRSTKPFVQLGGEESDLIEVYIYLYEKSDEAIAALQSAGVQVDQVSPSRPIVQAFVPVDSVESIASLSQVRMVSRPAYGLATAGAVTSQGYHLQQTRFISYFQRTSNPEDAIDGDGVTVGVISNGLFTSEAGATKFDFDLHGVSAPALPESLQTELPFGDRFTDSTQIPPQGYFGDVPVFPAFLPSHVMPFGAPFPEGTAMMEVIHDIAPNAAMIYADGRTSISHERAREFLVPGFRNATGVNINIRGLDVIVDNMQFVGEGRYDGSSVLSQDAAIITRKHNIPYVVTAGGSGSDSSESYANPDPFPLQVTHFFNADPLDNLKKVHSWIPRQGLQRDEGLAVQPESGSEHGVSTFEATLVWDDIWDDSDPRASIDLDMYLVPRSSLSISGAVAASTRIQNGNANNPVEKIFYAGASTQPLALVIVNKNARSNAKPLFTLTIERGQVAEDAYLTHAVPLNNSDALKPVISVGAIDLSGGVGRYQISRQVMPGINPGNTFTDSFNKWYDEQEFVTTLGYSAVNTHTSQTPLGTDSPFGGSEFTDQGFTGPSAAVAHTGGYIALLRHRFPNMSPTRLYDLFRDSSGIASDGSTEILPAAQIITPASTEEYHNHPVYRKLFHYGLYSALDSGLLDAYPEDTASAAPVLTVASTTGGNWTSDWNSSEPGDIEEGMDPAVVLASELGLELTPSSPFSYGYWESPTLSLQSSAGDAPRTELRTDRLYVIEARVGTTAQDSSQVPDFRLRLTSTDGDETSALLVSDMGEGVSDAPDSIGGKTYRLYYRPSSEEVASQGVKFYFELMHFDPNDDDNASIILRDFIFRELPLPEEDQPSLETAAVE